MRNGTPPTRASRALLRDAARFGSGCGAWGRQVQTYRISIVSNRIKSYHGDSAALSAIPGGGDWVRTVQLVQKQGFVFQASAGL